MSFAGAKIIFRAWDLYEHSAEPTKNETYIVAKQSDGDFGYFPTAEFALTSSNVFTGNQTINGNLIINGDITANEFLVTTSSVNHFTASTNFGLDEGDTHRFTGSVYITGSLNVIGGINGVINATNGVISSSAQITSFGFVSGSYETTGRSIISSSNQIKNYGDFATTGSNSFNGTQTITGSFLVSGSTTQIGNNTLTGNTQLSGTVSIESELELGGNLVPKIPKGATLGTLERPFRDIYLQSASINIASDIPGGRGAIISNADGNVTIQAAGFQLKSGSFVSFEVSETARTIIRAPQIPAGDIGAFSIIGNASGSYQPVTNAGGLIHLTGNDGQSSRITSDAYGTNANAALVGRKARGTAASPLPVQSNDTLTRISAIGWTGPEYGFTMSSSLTTAPTSIDVIALENFTTSSFGTAYRFFNSPIGNTTRVLSAQIDTSGLFVSGAFTASLSEGYFWVGGNGNRTTLITTSSFAKVGSNTFVGNQSLTGSLNITGSATINNNNIVTVSKGTFNPQFNDTSGSVVGVSQTGSYSLMDDVCFFRVNVDFANCTNFGTGQYQIQLPFPVNYKTTLRGGTLHQSSGSSGGTQYNITGLSTETGSTSTLLLYYTGTTSYLNWKYNTPVSASTTSSHFDINGTYQIG